MNSSQIEDNLKKLFSNCQQETFIYDFLLAYGLPKSSITRLQKGNLNLSKEKGELSWKKKVLFKEVIEDDLDQYQNLWRGDVKYRFDKV